jgi:hypothetical protein
MPPDVPPPSTDERPGDEIDRVVRLVVEGKITAKEAEQLLDELSGS